MAEISPFPVIIHSIAIAVGESYGNLNIDPFNLPSVRSGEGEIAAARVQNTRWLVADPRLLTEVRRTGGIESAPADNDIPESTVSKGTRIT